MRMNFEQLPAALQRGLSNAYLISGDEPLLVDEAADAIRAAARAAGYADRRVFFIDRSFDWNELRNDTQSLSLFAERRLFELRLPSGKPDKGAAQLAELAAQPPPDVVSLVITGKLDAKAATAPWVQAFTQHGVWIPVWPVKPEAMPGWLSARARLAGLNLTPAAAALIAERVEGNLLAAKQELQKLGMLAGKGAIDADMVLRSVGDSARYDVFQVAEAAAAGDARRSLHILLGLKNEGVEPTLILWALLRELRGLWQARERERLGSGPGSGQGSGHGSGWNLASKPSPQALSRLRQLPLAGLLVDAARADKIIKGLAAGDAWTALTGLTARLAGVERQRERRSA
jgi:DNA polymerase-3 subunit delta